MHNTYLNTLAWKGEDDLKMLRKITYCIVKVLMFIWLFLEHGLVQGTLQANRYHSVVFWELCGVGV